MWFIQFYLTSSMQHICHFSIFNKLDFLQVKFIKKIDTQISETVEKMKEKYLDT